MNQNKLSFESENLVVDYISFKFQKLDNFTLKEIASYLFEIGFNSYFVSGRLAKPIKESILVDPKNRYEVLFVIDNSYWEGYSESHEKAESHRSGTPWTNTEDKK